MRTKLRPSIPYFAATALTALVTAACNGGGTNGPTPPPTTPSPGHGTVLVEVDQMQGTPALQDSQELGGTTVSLAGIYAPGGMNMEVRHDQNDLPSAPTVRLADLHALLTAFRHDLGDRERAEWRS